MYIVTLYNIRRKKKYTQEEIVNATGVSKKTVSQLFSGKYYNYKLKS
ncbi:MAG: helix-turn-helix domain-containing protein [Candidatus Avigastranaerophilus sp.]